MLLSVFTRRVLCSFKKKNCGLFPHKGVLLRRLKALRRPKKKTSRAQREISPRHEQIIGKKDMVSLSLSFRKEREKKQSPLTNINDTNNTHNLCTPSRTDTLLSLPSDFFVEKKSSKTRRCRSSRSVSSAFGWLGRPLWTIFSPCCRGGSFSRGSISFLRRSRSPRSRRTASRETTTTLLLQNPVSVTLCDD
jgi:hypothetical protein